MLTDQRIHEAMMKAPNRYQRSALWDFLWKRYEEYGPQMRVRGFDWSNLAIRLNENGIMDGRGNPPTGRVAQQTFYKIRLVKEGEKAKRRPAKVKREIKRAFGKSAA